MDGLTAYRRLWPTLSTVGWMLSPHPVATMLPKRPKLRPQRSPLYSESETTRSDWALSPTSLGRAEMRPATTFPTLRFRLSAWSFCTRWCLRQFVSPCWSIRRMFQSPNACYTTCPKRRLPSGCKYRSSTLDEIEAAFVTLVRDQIDALFVGPDTLFISQRDQVTALTARYRILATFSTREEAEAGGLMSYG